MKLNKYIYPLLVGIIMSTSAKDAVKDFEEKTVQQATEKIIQSFPGLPLNIEPKTLELRMKNLNDHVKKGTDVQIEITPPVIEGMEILYGVHLLYHWYENPSLSTVTLVDSNGEDMGAVVGFIPSSRGNYRFVFERFPSAGSKWVRLTGKLPVGFLYGKTATGQTPLALEKNAATNIEGFDIKVIEKKQENDTHYIEFEIKNQSGLYRIDEIHMVDEKGKTIKNSIWPGFSLSENNTTYQTVGCFLNKMPGKVKLSIQHKKISKISVPLDIKFNLFTWNE